ncbi:ATP phosphoribosyltransferase regulatory subunit [Sinimarinibacterium sp. CAU 1509]|uniref:Eco57I restriction-modification methylase domain-containing protein n=1 Tax=Sinimarinibacterium sp. CAU 1509 TaxID=2562283 RepID=UPI0010AD45C6|nr:type IIL restriction-modification enzyme MmeI [Sinimarinibacterium sp. CAU 1509]TJY55316.1 ATP phosphoribosyltransferase regulatory subunit [Sinimarinibacterium sp. CAU 1509]
MNHLPQHHDWLALIEISGPFLAVPVLKEAFPQGLEELDGTKRKRLRQAYEEWREALETDDTQFDELHAAWIDEVLARGLELDEDGKGDVLKRADWCAANLNFTLPEHGVTLSPDLTVIDEQRGNKPLMLIQAYGQDVDLDATLKQDGWAATPADRIVQLCRAIGCRLGLVTNGERWMLVDAPVGAVTTFASWYARIWSQEPITLQAFVHLLGIRRFFVDEAEQLPALFDRSLKYQDEVTDALGEQVRRAVEVLIQALDKADQDRDRALLRDVKEPELYEAALTVMMRLVFLLSAEERGLLLLGDERYEANYALSTLRMQLRKESEEILERRWDAWSRLLAIFRAVFGGIEHENLRLPALGGSLFDPDRFPFLEGRAKGSDWRTDIAKPLPIDNRTVLLLLEAIQQFQGRTLSYRALDVEQIGYVYEGLLERTVKRTAEVTLELDGTKNAKAPWVKLAELESARLEGAECLAQLLQERSGSSASRVRNDLAKPVDDTLADRLLAACHGDTSLRNRIKPFAHLVRIDPWGYPLVYPAGAFIVTTGSDRRETGTHYTPKSLTEAIVTETLTPIAYVGPVEGTPREQWVLKSPAELLDLKICDPAMGSGAFLVQACRWLADRLVEAWSLAEGSGKTVSVDGEVLDSPGTKELLPRDTEARTVIARRLIAERCLYGVDLNPLAVELAKLSIWLVTLAKGRPFGFLDHNLRCGDSLLGIHRLDQLTELSMTPTGKGQQRLFGQNIERAVLEAIELRQRLRKKPIRDIRDVEAMATLDANARQKLEVPEHIADAFIGEVFAMGGNGAGLEDGPASLTIQAGQAVEGDRNALALMHRRSVASLSTDLPADKHSRRPFHWPLEFPEVFARDRAGFDVLVGNPPFKRGKDLSGILGSTYREWLVQQVASNRRGSADLVVYFFLRANQILRELGCFGLLATNTIAEGDTRQVGLEPLLAAGNCIYQAHPNEPWPGAAAVMVSRVHMYKGQWNGPVRLGSADVPIISAFLSAINEWSPKPLAENSGRSYQGSNILGLGFTMSEHDARALIEQDKRLEDVLFPYMIGEDLTSSPQQRASRWVINFWDWPLDRSASGRWEGASEEARAKWLKELRVPRDFPCKVAADFPDLLSIVEETVKPERAEKKRKQYRDIWWQFAEKQKALYAALGAGKFLSRELDGERSSATPSTHALCQVMISKYLAISMVPTSIVFSHRLVVFTVDAETFFSLLQSSIHEVWARKYGGTLETRMSYTPSDAFETFPFPSKVDAFGAVGHRFHELRNSVMRDRDIGMTALYNQFHQPSAQSVALTELRDLQREMDATVAHAYGWDDLDLEHGFHEVPYLPEKDRVRFTISETARVEVLRRLSELNRQRYEEEVTAGLHNGKTTGTGSRKPRVTSSENKPSRQPSFDFDGASANDGTYRKAAEQRASYQAGPTHAIVEYMKAHPGWHAKSDIVSAIGITDGQWNAAIAELIADNRIERQGEKRGARYRVVTEGAKE